MTVKRDHAYLQHILECSALIREYTKDGEFFRQSVLAPDGVMRRLQTIT